MMIGVDRVARSVLFQSRFSPSGDQRSTRPVARDTPFCSGPRHIGQSSGSAADSPAPSGAKPAVSSRAMKRVVRPREVTLMEDSRKVRSIEIGKVRGSFRIRREQTGGKLVAGEDSHYLWSTAAMGSDKVSGRARP